VEFLPTVFATGWTSGVNAYLCVLMLGLISRFGDVAAIPSGLGRTEVLLIAGAMFAIEAVVDKIPYLDSGWDAISTVVRPTVGAVLGLLIAGDGSSVQQALMAVTGGGTALLSHLTKSSLRLAVNASPEPASNIAASTGEDLAVAGITALVAFHPWLAFSISLAVLVVGIVLAAVLARSIRRGYRRWRDHRRRAFAPV
jgi:heme exporter protein D